MSEQDINDNSPFIGEHVAMIEDITQQEALGAELWQSQSLPEKRPIVDMRKGVKHG